MTNDEIPCFLKRSVTGKKYHGTTNDDGTLKIVDIETGQEVLNNSNPSKKAIVGQAIIDLGGKSTKDETLSIVRFITIQITVFTITNCKK